MAHHSHSEYLKASVTETNFNPTDYLQSSKQCYRNPVVISYPTPLIKPQEEAIQIAAKHQPHDSISSTFYTDGSKSSDGVGAAYCQIKNQDIVHNDNIKSHRSNTIFQAEATAILECLLFIKSNDCYVATIFSDSQSVLKSLTAFSKDPLITDIQHIYTGKI